MFDNIFQIVNDLIFSLFKFLTFKPKSILNNDVESCFSTTDDTTTYTE
jgi:hypothetical protein